MVHLVLRRVDHVALVTSVTVVHVKEPVLSGGEKAEKRRVEGVIDA